MPSVSTAKGSHRVSANRVDTTVLKNNKLYRLPETNLYRDSRDMCLVSFLIYVWARVVNVLKDELHVSTPKSGDWSPKDVKRFIMRHRAALEKKYPNEFKEGSLTYHALGVLEQRSPNRELTLVKWDSDYQTEELVFGICQDSINKRITLVFRGTEASMAFKSNWEANLDIGKSAEQLPEALQGKLPSGHKKVWIHSGFYEYMNKPTEDPTDHVERSKREQVLDAVKEVLRQYPRYRIYTTGHSLGAAMATLASYYLATDPDIIPNCPVTCLNFASPRVGDGNFLDAVQVLERKGLLRICRFVNNKDLICVLPTFNYKHVGFMVKLDSQPGKMIKVCYPKFNETWGRWWERAIAMSWPAAFNLTYDHSAGEYGRRIELYKKQLETKFLDKLYWDDLRTGFIHKKMFGEEEL